MIEYAEDVLADMENAAREMMKNGESFREVALGRTPGTCSLLLSDDRNKVIVDRIINVDGKEFFIGLFEK